MHPEPPRKFYLKEFKAISCAISTYEDLNLLFDHFVEGVARAFNIKGASIMLYDEALDQLFHVSSHGISNDYLGKGPVFLRDQEDAFKKGEPVYIQNLENDPRVQYMEAARSENIQAMLSFPIKCRAFVVGVLRLYGSQAIALHPDDVDSILVLSMHLGLAIEETGLRNCLQIVNSAIHRLPPRMRKDD